PTPPPEPAAPPAATPAPTAQPTPDPTAAPDPTATPDPTPDPTATPDPSTAPTPAADTNISPYIVTFVTGTSSAQQRSAIADAGATDLDSIAVLRMHAISAGDAGVAALRADARVSSVDPDRSRAAEAPPVDASS